MTATAGTDGDAVSPAPVSWLNGLETPCLIEEVRRPLATAGLHPETGRRAAAAAAYHGARAAGGRPLMIAWSRPATGGPLHVISTTSLASSRYPAPLRFPPDAKGRPLAPSAARDLLTSGLTAWVPIAGAVDHLLVSDHLAESALASLPLERGLLTAWHEPFAWILLAYPLGLKEIIGYAENAAQEEHAARSVASRPENVLTAERASRRHREARTGTSTGLWHIRLLAGGTSPAAAATIAGLLVAATDLGTSGYTLAPVDRAVPFDRAVTYDTAASLNEPGVDDHTTFDYAVPIVGGSTLLACLAQVPRTEVPGVRLTWRPEFDVTPESTREADAVELGQILDHDDQFAGPLRIGHGALNRHVFVCGATGSGKSQTVRTLLEALSSDPSPVPWLVIEPAKAEYARMAGRLRDPRNVLVIRPGDPDAIPGCLNPLEPEPGFPLQTHIDLIRALFQAAFEAHEPLPQVLAQALTRCYEEFGWQIALGEPVNPGVRRYPTLSDLRRVAVKVVEDIGYGSELANNVRGFVDVRLGSLTLGTTGRFFEGGHPLDLPALLERNTVLELEDIGNDQDKAFFIGAVLIRITEHLRRRGDDGTGVRLRHITVIEEAHRLLRRVDSASPAAHAVELFASLLAEVRAYGEGIIVAEQIPAKIIPDVVKNTAVKIVHRLPAQDDRGSVGATMNLTEEQSRYVVTLPPGQAAVFADGMDQPVLTAIPLGESRETTTGVDRDPDILRTRSAACSTECRQRACTVRQMATGASLAEDPELILWIELLTVAHIVGQPSPLAKAEWLADLRTRADSRTVLCAVGHCVHRSIEARYRGLARYYNPEELATHLADHAATVLAGGATGCDGSEVQWQAAHFRWIDVDRALGKGRDTDAPHPHTEKWRARGINLPGRTQGEQHAQYRRVAAVRQHDDETVRGSVNPPLYERAARALADQAEPRDRFKRAMRFLKTETTWPEQRLYPDAAPHRKDES